MRATLSTEITTRRKKTHQLLAELDGSILVALLPPLAASAEDADPPEPRGHRRHAHHHRLRCCYLLDLHVMSCVHIYATSYSSLQFMLICSPPPLGPCSNGGAAEWGRYPTTAWAWLALLHSIAPPHLAVTYTSQGRWAPQELIIIW